MSESGSESLTGDFVILHDNLSKFPTETRFPTHLLPTISSDIMSPLSIIDQRYHVSTAEELDLFNKLRIGINIADVIP